MVLGSSWGGDIVLPEQIGNSTASNDKTKCINTANP
ncbi:hypothetical protein BH23THE1_BH23THE1_24600 [soil metagenome]